MRTEGPGARGRGAGWLAVLLATAAFGQDFTIVPGERVGPITGRSVRADLARWFPADAIEDDQIELDEGMLQNATLIYRKDPSQTLAISWTAAGTPRQIFVCWGQRRGACRWQAANGIRFGTRLAELETLNGGRFTIAGFGYNYGGNVLSWNGGKLARAECNGRLVLTLDGERSGGRYTVAITNEELRSIRGDRPISSSTPAFHKLNPRVVGMLMVFSSPGSGKCE
jgi:hypothetical protein